MGRYRFRFSDMIPNAWFHKLKYMSTRTNTSKKTTRILPTTTKPLIPQPSPLKQTINQGRASYYIKRPDDSPTHPKASDTKFLPAEPPRKSKKKTQKPPPPSKLVRSSESSNHSCRAMPKAAEYEYPPLPASPVYDGYADELDGIPCFDKPVIAEQVDCSGTRSMSASSSSLSSKSSGVEMDYLPPILTRPAKKELQRKKMNSPRIAGRKPVQVRRIGMGTPRKGLAGSFAVVKASSDPRRDFMESMVDMIVENNMKTSKDLEELLACYLSLNSTEYHDVIVKVFEQVWFDLTSTIVSK